MGYDGLLIFGLCLMIYFPIVIATNQRIPPRLAWAVILLTTVVFYSYFWVRHGRTLGMQAWHFELRSDQGGRITITQALLRFTVLMPALLIIEAAEFFRPSIIIGLLYFQANYLWMWFNPARRTVTDLVSGSRMLRT